LILGDLLLDVKPCARPASTPKKNKHQRSPAPSNTKHRLDPASPEKKRERERERRERKRKRKG